MAENNDWFKDTTQGSHGDNGFGTRSTQAEVKDFNPRATQYNKNNFDSRPVTESTDSGKQE